MSIEVEIPVSSVHTRAAVLNHVGEHPMLGVPAIGFDATGTVRRSDFGLGDHLPFVSDEVQIRITGEGLEPAALAKMKEIINAMASSASEEE